MAQVIQTVDQVLSNAAQIIIQSTGSGSCQIVRATVANYDTVSHNVTFWRVPPGASVSNGTLMVPNCSVLAGQTVSPPINGQALVGDGSGCRRNKKGCRDWQPWKNLL